ncbi:MAG: LysM peptidoglycan-binding domain-containing protein [Acidobacteriota bacterium]|nr:LysM peptidoglycan-binding domain-containing protein [Acidobacteriota bacterium]
MPATPVPTPDDPVTAVLAASDGHFQQGQAALKLGHLDEARAEFNQAVDVLLKWPGGVNADIRLRRRFDDLVDRISTEELTALAEGDGFTEKKYEPASIDQLLALSTFGKATPPPDWQKLEQTVSSDLQQPGHDLSIPLNDQVLSYVELFSGKLHDWFQASLDRGSPYLPMIRRVFRADGLPQDLAYVPIVESAFKSDALSRASAKGVWQFMRTTAVENGLKHDWYVDERSDPRKATLAAAKYLQTLEQTFDGNWPLALASYNGGPGRVQGAIRRAHGVTDFWALAAKPRLLPRETREYVPMILAAIIVARNPTKYGFTVPHVQPVICDTVKLPQPVDLRRVAEWTGTSVEQIQALNPELRRWTTPVRAKDYELKVPQGTGDLVRARLQDAEGSDVDLASLRWYTVRRGESLLGIARRLRVRRSDLAEANYLSIRARLRAGQKLIVPREPGVILSARAGDDSSAQVVAASREEERRVRITYRVRRGDTLYRIARQFDTSVERLKRWNHLRGTRLSIGARLTVYTLESLADAGQE